MSLSTAARMSANSSSANASSAGPVLPSFAQTFSDLAGNAHTRSPPQNQNSHSFHADIDFPSSAERDRRDQDRDRDRERERDRDRDRDRTGREQDHAHSHSEHRSRLSSHKQDTVLPPIRSHQDTHISNSKKRSLDDLHREEDREHERRQDPVRDDRVKESERQSPSQIKREPSLSPPPDQHPPQHTRYLQQPHPTSHSYSYPHHHHTSHAANSSNKRRKNNHEYPPSPSDPSFSNERDTEHSFNETYSHPHAPALAQSNPPSASSSSTHTSPPMKRLSAMGSRANSLSPHQSANVIHPQTSSHNSSRSPNQAPLQPPPISKSPSQSHLRPPSQQPYQPSLLSSHFSMALPAPSDSFSTNRKKKLSAQYQGDISVPVPRPINTGSGSATPAMATAGSGSGPGSALPPGSASGPGLISAASNSGVNNTSGSNTNHHHHHPPHPPNNSIANNNNLVVANSTTPRGPPRHLTIAPHPRTRRLEPVIHSAPVNGGFFHGAGKDNMNANASGSVGGVTIRSVGVSSVRLHAHAADYNSTSSSLMAPASGSNTTTTAATASSSLHPPVTPMRIPELPPIPITPNGRKNITSATTNDHLLSHSYSRLPPPHSAGLLGRFDKETTERPAIVGSSRFVLDRERLEKDRERLMLERDRSERDRGADVPIAKNGGMRSGMVLGSINVPRTPLFSSFGQQPANNNTNTVGARQGRSASSQHPPSSSKYLQVPHTAGLNQSSSNGTDAPLSSSLSARQATPHATASLSNPSGATNGSLPDPKSSFLTLFSDFYDSLADSKLLKSWLHEQLVKSNTLIEHLEKAAKSGGGGGGGGGGGTSSTVVGALDTSPPASSSTTITLTVAQLEGMIERRLGPVKNETEGLKRRVGELEEMVYEARKSGWGGDAEVSKKRRRHEESSSSTSMSTSTAVQPPPVSIRTSPPPPLILTPSSVASNAIPRAPASAPLLLEDRNRHLGVPLARDIGEAGIVDKNAKPNDKGPQEIVSGSPPRSHSRSHSRTRKTGTDGHDPIRSLKNSERETDVDMDGRVNRSDDDTDEPMAILSVSEHQTSAVRLEC